MGKYTLSVVVPVFNERENVAPLFNELQKTLKNLVKDKIVKKFEVIIVDDGSRDGTQTELENLKKTGDSNLKLVLLRRNFGQTAALRAGFDNSSGDLIVTMDGDMQNDPADIPKLITKLEEGYDVVSGWRVKRMDKFFKRISSKTMNLLRKKMIGDYLHDYGCSLKIYRRECLADLELFGELHRYITAYLYIKGYRIGEIRVNHRNRTRGKTKYGFSRGINGVLDLVFLKYWQNFSHRPLHFFGRLGIYQWLLAFIIVIEQIIKAIIIRELALGPLLALSAMFAITGLLTIVFGFMSEVMARNYFKNLNIYSIRRII